MRFDLRHRHNVELAALEAAEEQGTVPSSSAGGETDADADAGVAAVTAAAASLNVAGSAAASADDEKEKRKAKAQKKKQKALEKELERYRVNLALPAHIDYHLCTAILIIAVYLIILRCIDPAVAVVELDAREALCANLLLPLQAQPLSQLWVCTLLYHLHLGATMCKFIISSVAVCCATPCSACFCAVCALSTMLRILVSPSHMRSVTHFPRHNHSHSCCLLVSLLCV
jgi:hypothetical protein